MPCHDAPKAHTSHPPRDPFADHHRAHIALQQGWNYAICYQPRRRSDSESQNVKGSGSRFIYYSTGMFFVEKYGISDLVQTVESLEWSQGIVPIIYW
jgi:hypothetical protein